MLNVDDAVAAEVGGRPNGRSWWKWEDVQDTIRPSKSKQYTEWQSSLSLIAEALEEHAPIDGILGFSQGATILALFLAQRTRGDISCQYLPHFAILVGGFMPRDVSIAQYIIEGRPSLRSLHIYGQNDDLVCHT